MKTITKRPELTMEAVEKSVIYCDIQMRETGIYDGVKTFIELPITEVAELGFNVDIDEYCFSLEEAALNALLREAGVKTEAVKSDGVVINIGMPRSQEELYTSSVLQLNVSNELTSRTGSLVRDIVNESWPHTYRLAPDEVRPTVMRKYTTRNLTGEWQSKDELARNAVSALFEVFEPGFADNLAKRLHEAERV